MTPIECSEHFTPKPHHHNSKRPDAYRHCGDDAFLGGCLLCEYGAPVYQRDLPKLIRTVIEEAMAAYHEGFGEDLARLNEAVGKLPPNWADQVVIEQRNAR